MSIFNELIIKKITEIQTQTARNFDDALKAMLESGDRLEQELLMGRSNAQKEKTLTTTLQSINEDDDEPITGPATESEIDDEGIHDKKKVTKKRSRDQVASMSSPEVLKRPKRSASVKAKSNISKQSGRKALKDLDENDNDVIFVSTTDAVNVNLTQKLRRESSTEKSRRGRGKNSDKENAEPLTVQIKQEKISVPNIVPQEPMDTDSLPVNIVLKKQLSKDNIAMLPPIAPVPNEPITGPATESEIDDEGIHDKKKVTKKRSRDQVASMSSPEVLKRPKRSASVKAKSNISKQSGRKALKDLDENDNDVIFVSTTDAVNVNLTQKLRRESSTEKSRRGRGKNSDKENAEPLTVQIKQEKISVPNIVPQEPMDTDSLPVNIVLKKQLSKDNIAMLPPIAPVPNEPITGPATESEIDDEGIHDKKKVTKKRSRDQVASMSSPEVLKRPKRSASVKAKSNISKQSGRKALKDLDENDNDVIFVSTTDAVNVNLTQKLRRESSTEKSRRGRGKNSDKENAEPLTGQIKQEKISVPNIVPQEPMDTDSLPVNIVLKKQLSKDNIAMLPPIAPVPKPSARSTRASSRASSRANKLLENNKPDDETSAPELPATRPKRTRGIKKASEESIPQEPKKVLPQEETIGSPAEKPKPKRTRRVQKLEKESHSSQEDVPQSTKPQIRTKKERTSPPEQNSPVLTKLQKPSKNTKKVKAENSKRDISKKDVEMNSEDNEIDGSSCSKVGLIETRIIEKEDMDATVVLPTAVYNHDPVTPKAINAANATFVIEEPHSDANPAMDATVVLDKNPESKATNITDDNSLVTDDSQPEVDSPSKLMPKAQPKSAVKEKVQLFEDLAARTTRTKTRAMAKLDKPDNHTPAEKIIKPVLPSETLSKMNNMIIKGKAPQRSTSASKQRVTPPPKPVTVSASKLSSVSRHRHAAQEAKLDKEDARKKKEAMLEAKRELQKKKREEKMAAAAAARVAAEKERSLAMKQAAKERMEKQAHADLGKQERLKEVERKKQELARKVAETEERRKAEEQARQLRLAEEQRKMEVARRMQLEQAEAIKKEAALAAKEMEMRQKEYMEKQQKLNKMHTYTKSPGTPSQRPQDPVHMEDGFQYLNSDEDEELTVIRPIPAWSTSKMRREALMDQSEIESDLIDEFFLVQYQSVDLREIFPNIDRSRLKRTSSAVWRTPPPGPSRLPELPE